MAEGAEETNLVAMTAEIVSAYAASNPVKADDLVELIKGVHGALKTAGEPAAAAEPETSRVTPAQIRKSVTPDHLISFLDGRPYKSLKRHVSTYGLSPDEYRSKYGLPRDYPMVSANYSAQRSELARKIGLGNRGAKTSPSASAPKGRKSQPQTE